ncbi:MAG TPA: hypothetical protein VF228_24855 [Iamia sp.]
MTLRRLVLASVLVVVVGLATSHPAGADCIGPTIEHTVGTVDRSDTIHVVGTGWGDDCYDTGAPPAGVGVLGDPHVGIEIVLVQREVEHVVATGDADADYGFVVDVPIPDELTPGWVAVVARPPEGMPAYDVTKDPVVVSDVAPSAGGPGDDPVTFGPADDAEPTPTVPRETDDDPSIIGTIVVIVVVVALTTAVVVLFSRARQGPTGPRPV